MARSAVVVRSAIPDDLPHLLRLWQEFVDGWGSRAWRERTDFAQRFKELLTDPSVRVIVAVGTDGPVGMAVLSETTLGPLSDLGTLQMSYVIVASAHRRRGVGRSLVAAAAGYAEDRGLEQVLVNVLPTMREANRFYARLGFAPVVVRRVAPVALLRSRLASTDRRPLVNDVIRRRTLRRSPAYHGIPSTPTD